MRILLPSLCCLLALFGSTDIVEGANTTFEPALTFSNLSGTVNSHESFMRGCAATITTIGGATVVTVLTACYPCERGFHIYSGDCQGQNMNEITQWFTSWSKSDLGWTGTAVFTPALPPSTCNMCVGIAVSCDEPSCIDVCTANVYCP